MTPDARPDDTRLRTAFADLFRREQGRIYGYLHSLVRDAHDADDLLQQTTLILWNKFESFDASRSFFSWACGVARGEAANFLRSRARRPLWFSDEVSLLLIEAAEALDEGEIEERRAALRHCLDGLAERDQALVQECYGGDDGVSAVAARTGRSSQSVYNSLRRIRRALAECAERHLRQTGEGRP